MLSPVFVRFLVRKVPSSGGQWLPVALLLLSSFFVFGGGGGGGGVVQLCH